MDRASGSGVFARDADALLDMIQLEVDQVGVPGTGWRLEGTLREFRTFEPLNLWFEYPIHKIDDSGTLASLTPDAEKEPWKKSQEVRQKKKEAKKSQMESAYNACLINGDVTVTDMANYLETTDRTVRRYINENKMFEYREGKVIKKKIECDGI
jgi:RecA-family ATPase